MPFSSLTFLDLHVATALLKFHGRFSLRLKSGLFWTREPSRTSCENLGETIFPLKGTMSSNFLLARGWHEVFSFDFWYLIESILFSTCCRFSVPQEPKQPHNITEPSPVFTVGRVFFLDTNCTQIRVHLEKKLEDVRAELLFHFFPGCGWSCRIFLPVIEKSVIWAAATVYVKRFFKKILNQRCVVGLWICVNVCESHHQNKNVCGWVKANL